MGSLSTEPEDAARVVTLSAEELKRGAYTPLSLIRALEALHQDGLVVLRGVVHVDHVDALNTRMCKDADERLADNTQEFNHNVKSNFLQRPPITETELLYEDVYFNPFVLQVGNAYLGHRPVWNWLTANTAVANTTGMRQPVHKDCAFEHPMFPYYFIANIPLCDFSETNGATEFWLGSHAHTSWRDNDILTNVADTPGPFSRLNEPVPNVSAAARQARRLVRAPLQPSLCRGDIVIRDLRTWHAGMPNNSDRHRIMIGLGYQSPAHPNYTMRVHLPAAQRSFFLGSAPANVDVRANVYSDEELAALKIDSFFDLRPEYLE